MPSEATSPRERPVPPSMIITSVLNPLTSLLTINPAGFIHSKTAEFKLYAEQRRGERFLCIAYAGCRPHSDGRFGSAMNRDYALFATNQLKDSIS